MTNISLSKALHPDIGGIDSIHSVRGGEWISAQQLYNLSQTLLIKIIDATS